MHPADFYELVRCDRERAARHLHCYDGPGLRWFAVGCAQHLVERFAVPVPPEHVIHIWQHVALITEQQAQEALVLQERAVGK
jgi:hypothetical protein